jgi:hypothetical protein
MLNRIYGPETIAVMSAALHSACRSLSTRSGSDDVRRTLALTILRRVNEGERDPTRLSDIAASELAGMQRADTG